MDFFLVAGLAGCVPGWEATEPGLQNIFFIRQRYISRRVVRLHDPEPFNLNRKHFALKRRGAHFLCRFSSCPLDSV